MRFGQAAARVGRRRSAPPRVGVRSGRDGEVAEFDGAAVFELLEQLAVERLQLLGIVPGQGDAAPDAVGGTYGDGVVAATADEGARLAGAHGVNAVFEGREPEIPVAGASTTGGGLTGVKKSPVTPAQRIHVRIPFLLR